MVDGDSTTAHWEGGMYMAHKSSQVGDRTRESKQNKVRFSGVVQLGTGQVKLSQVNGWRGVACHVMMSGFRLSWVLGS